MGENTMPADSNIPVLGRIAAAIHPNPENYEHGRDYYGSPVHTALERELNDDSWPHVRKEYLFDDKGNLTVFPHKKWLDDAEKRDLPATFFYEVIRLAQCKNIDNEIFPAQCVNYYNFEHKDRAAKIIRNHARRWFFSLLCVCSWPRNY